MTTTISGVDGIDKVKDINAVSFLPFTKEYTSPQLTIPGAVGLLTLEHSLGVVPKLVVGSLVCTVANNNYSVGDIAPVNLFLDIDATQYGTAMRISATSIEMRFTNGLLIGNIVTSSASPVNPSQWKLIVRACP